MGGMSDVMVQRVSNCDTLRRHKSTYKAMAYRVIVRLNSITALLRLIPQTMTEHFNSHKQSHHVDIWLQISMQTIYPAWMFWERRNPRVNVSISTPDTTLVVISCCVACPNHEVYHETVSGFQWSFLHNMDPSLCLYSGTELRHWCERCIPTEI